ncbi:MAG: TetR/AcrR family transcriptional regulator [Phenylobacterium sp.]
MTSRAAYHHGDLREALVRAAQAALETHGPEAVSLRAIAEQLAVSRGAPYRHFADRRALLAEVAARGFADLAEAYERAQAGAPDPTAALRETARAYLALAFGRPGLFRLMFYSDLLAVDPPPNLIAPAAAAWEGFYEAVVRADPDAAIADNKRRALTGWSTLHGFIALVQGGRLRSFMTEPLTEAELVEAVIDKTMGEDVAHHRSANGK